MDLDNEESKNSSARFSGVLCDVSGFLLAYTTYPTPAVVFAQFDHPDQCYVPVNH